MSNRSKRRRRVVPLDRLRTPQAMASIEQSKASLEETEEALRNLLVKVLEIVAMHAGLTDAEVTDESIVPADWYADPDPERVQGFWNLSVERQVAFRNLSGRLRRLVETRMEFDMAINLHLKMLDAAGGVTAESLAYLKSTSHLLDDYMHAVESALDASDAFVDGEAIVLDPRQKLVDTGTED